MDIRLAMLDVDGTLMHEGDWFPQARELLTALHAAGVAVALCSGRAIDSLLVTASQCPEVSLLAGAGGSIVLRRDGAGWARVGTRFLPRATVDEVARRTAELGMELWAYTDERWLVRERTPRVEHDEQFTHAISHAADLTGRDDVIKLLTFADTAEHEAYRREIATWEGVGVASSYPGYWDILPSASLETKGGDLLTEVHGCTWAQTLAAGDGSNDLGMLSRAGLCYALAPRRLDELAPADADQQRQAVPGIAAVLADLRARGIVAA